MPDLTPLTPPGQDLLRPESAAYRVAATAVLAGKFKRPTLRVHSARLYPHPGLTFEDTATPQALHANRAYLEETVMTLLAAPAAEQIKFGHTPDAPALEEARTLLLGAARNDDEAEAVGAYLAVLLARARGELRRAWVEVEVVGMALQERGVLEGLEVRHRIECVQGIRSATLN